MRSIRNALIGFAAVIMAIVAMPAQAQSPGPLDGLWESVNTPDAVSIARGANGFQENVLIQDSMATREIFSQFGFLPTPSTILTTTPIITYECVYVADKFGTLRVLGTVNSTNAISGTMTWTHPDGKVWNYTFSMVKIGTGPTPPAP
jgi:hypothetical protein